MNKYFIERLDLLYEFIYISIYRHTFIRTHVHIWYLYVYLFILSFFLFSKSNKQQINTFTCWQIFSRFTFLLTPSSLFYYLLGFLWRTHTHTWNSLRLFYLYARIWRLLLIYIIIIIIVTIITIIVLIKSIGISIVLFLCTLFTKNKFL